MITKITSYREGQVVFDFDNGNNLSFIWHAYAYSNTKADKNKLEATKVECMATGDNIIDYLRGKYGDNPAGYIPVKDIPKIITEANRRY